MTGRPWVDDPPVPDWQQAGARPDHPLNLDLGGGRYSRRTALEPVDPHAVRPDRVRWHRSAERGQAVAAVAVLLVAVGGIAVVLALALLGRYDSTPFYDPLQVDPPPATSSTAEQLVEPVAVVEPLEPAPSAEAPPETPWWVMPLVVGTFIPGALLAAGKVLSAVTVKRKARRRTTRLLWGLVRINWAGFAPSSVTVPGIRYTHVVWERKKPGKGHRSHDDDRD